MIVNQLNFMGGGRKPYAAPEMEAIGLAHGSDTICTSILGTGEGSEDPEEF